MPNGDKEVWISEAGCDNWRATYRTTRSAVIAAGSAVEFIHPDYPGGVIPGSSGSSGPYPVIEDVDFNNDGYADRLVMSGKSSIKDKDAAPFTGWWASYSSVDESTGVVSYLPWVQVSNEGWSDLSKTAFVDANGDELIDVVRADGDAWKVNYNRDGSETTSNGYVFSDADSLRAGANATLAGDHMVFGNFNDESSWTHQYRRDGKWYTIYATRDSAEGAPTTIDISSRNSTRCRITPIFRPAARPT